MLLFSEIHSGKIFNTGWRRGAVNYFLFEVFDLKLVFGYISQCNNYFRKLPITQLAQGGQNLKN